MAGADTSLDSDRNSLQGPATRLVRMAWVEGRGTDGVGPGGWQRITVDRTGTGQTGQGRFTIFWPCVRTSMLHGPRRWCVTAPDEAASLDWTSAQERHGHTKTLTWHGHGRTGSLMGPWCCRVWLGGHFEPCCVAVAAVAAGCSGPMRCCGCCGWSCYLQRAHPLLRTVAIVAADAAGAADCSGSICCCCWYQGVRTGAGCPDGGRGG
jgi:hypothetical protein